MVINYQCPIKRFTHGCLFGMRKGRSLALFTGLKYSPPEAQYGYIFHAGAMITAA